MEYRPYEKVLLFSGILTSIGIPESLTEALEERFGRISYWSPEIDFDFTDYYDEEMQGPIRRLFIAFDELTTPDKLAEAKVFTNELEERYAVDGNRRINLDPGIISVSNLILATTKNRAHRIAIGHDLYAEVTLIYHRKGWEAFSWTYADYRSPEVQEMLLDMRRHYLKALRNQTNLNYEVCSEDSERH